MSQKFDFKKDILDVKSDLSGEKGRNFEARLNFVQGNLINLLAYFNALASLVLEHTNITAKEYQLRAKSFLEARDGVKRANED